MFQLTTVILSVAVAAPLYMPKCVLVGRDEIESGINTGDAGGDFDVEGPAVEQIAAPLERLAIGGKRESSEILDGAGGAVLAGNPLGIVERQVPGVAGMVRRAWKILRGASVASTEREMCGAGDCALAGFFAGCAFCARAGNAKVTSSNSRKSRYEEISWAYFSPVGRAGAKLGANRTRFLELAAHGSKLIVNRDRARLGERVSFQQPAGSNLSRTFQCDPVH